MLKKIALLLLLFLASFLTGCWNRTEITDMAVVLGTGVDWTQDGRLSLTIQIAKSRAFAGVEAAGGREEAANWVVTAEGKTIEEAAGNLAAKVPRKVFWDHCMILIVGEEMARKGMNLIIDFFLRSREPRETMWLIVAEGEAKDFLETYANLEKSSAQAMGSLNKIKTGYSVRLWEFAEMLANKGIQPVAPRVEVKKEAGITPGPGQGQETRLPAHKQVGIYGVGVFKGEKLIGWLDDYATSGLIWLKGESLKGAVVVPDPGEPDKGVSIAIRRNSLRVVPEYDGKNLRFYVKVKIEGDMVEQQSRGDLAKKEMIKVLEKELAEEIKKRASAALEKAQKEYVADIFGFGEVFRRKYKKAWQELQDGWNTALAGAEVNLEIEANVREVGLLSKGAAAPEE